MERFCTVFTIKPGTEEEYDRRHREIWPEMAEAIRASGISNYTLFRHGLQVVSYGEAEPDAETALGRSAATEVSRRWQESMAYALDGEFLSADEVWHLD